MTKENETLKIDYDFYISATENIVNSDPGYHEALDKFQELFDSLKEKGLTKEAMEFDNIVSCMETAVREAVYKKAFEAGIRFILNAITGKEVIEI
jgi:hypothetical protein